jgi:hypothetical protein
MLRPLTTLPQASRAVLPALDVDLEQAVNYARAEKASSTRRRAFGRMMLLKGWYPVIVSSKSIRPDLREWFQR